MPRKAKPTKHSAKDLKKKAALASTDRGGGKKGMKARSGGGTGGAKFRCWICATNAPSEKSMIIHFDAKHPKETFSLEKCTVNTVKKDMDAKRARIGNAGPSAICGKGTRQKKKDEKRLKKAGRGDKAITENDFRLWQK